MMVKDILVTSFYTSDLNFHLLKQTYYWAVSFMKITDYIQILESKP